MFLVFCLVLFSSHSIVSSLDAAEGKPYIIEAGKLREEIHLLTEGPAQRIIDLLCDDPSHKTRRSHRVIRAIQTILCTVPDLIAGISGAMAIRPGDADSFATQAAKLALCFMADKESITLFFKLMWTLRLPMMQLPAITDSDRQKRLLPIQCCLAQLFLLHAPTFWVPLDGKLKKAVAELAAETPSLVALLSAAKT